jgi:hypothetical protein
LFKSWLLEGLFLGNQLDHVLKIKIAPDERDRLLAEARSLMGGD